MNATQELLALFKAEVLERLESLEQLVQGPPEGWDLAHLRRIAHNIKGAARIAGVDGVQEVAHLMEDLLAGANSGDILSPDAVELMREGVRLLKICLGSMDGPSSPSVAAYRDRVKGGAPAGPRPPEASAPAAPKPESRRAPDTGSGAPSEPRAAADTLRVTTHKVDRLMGLASELTTSGRGSEEYDQALRELTGSLQTLARQFPGIKATPSFRAALGNAQELRRSLTAEGGLRSKLASQLQEAVRALRLVRIDSLRAVLDRVVQDACGHTGRQATLDVAGGSTEVDRAVLEALRDPLVHLLRNAIAHGIETPAERVKLGKPAVGRVTLRARSSGAWVEVAVADDGRGFNLHAIRLRAVERGWISPPELETTEEEVLLGFIFRAGFSTAETPNQVSGRGIGLEVVRENLEGIGGSIQVESSPGRGATYCLEVPLTRLTTSGIIARLGAHYVAAPLVSVEQTFFVTPADVRMVDNEPVVAVNGEPIPLLALEGALKIEADRREKRPALLLSEGRTRRAVLVDQVLGCRDFVMQPLNWNLRHVPGLIATTVIEGGRVVLVLNTRELLHLGVRRSSELAGSSARRARRVVVADDSVTSRTLLRNILASAGYEILVAVDGRQAWQILQEKPADLLITDVEMPEIDGFELTRKVRAHETMAGLPVIVVTSLGNEEHRMQGAEAGANAYVVKGAFDQDELLRAIARCL
ncbi:MAG: response regulator [Armatimonadetes bacterium]|nr:response regulator [Armatimonadota bacterium]